MTETMTEPADETEATGLSLSDRSHLRLRNDEDKKYCQNGFLGSSSHLLIGHRLNGFQISVGNLSGVFARCRQAGGLQVFFRRKV